MYAHTHARTQQQGKCIVKEDCTHGHMSTITRHALGLQVHRLQGVRWGEGLKEIAAEAEGVRTEGAAYVIFFEGRT